MTGLSLALPREVAQALLAPTAAATSTVMAAEITFFLRSWGVAGARSLLLLHGALSSSLGWWRVGPALAAAGFRVHAPDMPGHGLTRPWRGRWQFRDNARDLAMLAEQLGIRAEEMHLVGHSWGAMTAAAFPVIGFSPARLVLIDPPVLPVADMEAVANDPIERRYQTYDEAVAAMGGANPTWAFGDVAAKAEALTQIDEAAVRDVLVSNDYDGGYADLSDPSAASVERWLIRGDPTAGGLTPDATAARYEALLGTDRVMTIPGSPHSPHRTHAAETVAAILRALGAV